MNQNIPFLRIFLSSPGDVNQERQIAMQMIEQLPYRPVFREQVAFRVIAWDKPGAGTVMRATLTPQEAINQGLPKPSECDIVIVLFWSRMGTPFKDTDGKEYLSGTHWELLDAINADRPETLIYHRQEKPDFGDPDVPAYDDNLAQYRTLQAFLKSDLFFKDGQIQRGVNMYHTPEDFRREFENNFEELVVDILRKQGHHLLKNPDPVPTTDNAHITTITTQQWDGSPFPGLRAFTPTDEKIFFGRAGEVADLARMLGDTNLVAVVGASGSGKSSLVGAGLIPALRANAVTGSKDWILPDFDPEASEEGRWMGTRFTPGAADGNPFEALYSALLQAVPELRPTDPMDAPRRKKQFIGDMVADPSTLADVLGVALADRESWTKVLFFVDQFEELFTLTKAELRKPFAALISHKSERAQFVVTMRSDFYHQALPYLEKPLREGSFTLDKPDLFALREMIERPAERAGIDLEDGLSRQIIQDTGDDPGALALMAYALDELYKITEQRGDRCITFADYKALGGVQGAIGIRAEDVFARQVGEEEAKERTLQQVFHGLIEVDERGTATRRRAVFEPESLTEDMLEMIYAFADARLLTTSSDNGAAMVEVAHEAILRNWERLADWIEETADDRRLIRRMEREAEDWKRQGKPDFMKPSAEELKKLGEACEELNVTITDPLVLDYIEPEQCRLYRELGFIVHPLEKGQVDVTPTEAIAGTTHPRRYTIGERLNDIGDIRRGVGVKDGLPDIEWLPVTPGGNIDIENQTFTVKPFYIAKYLISHAQFQAFLDAPDGFNNDEWWQGLTEKYRKQEMSSATNQNTNAPRDSVSWYQCVAFTRWLNAKYREAGLFDQFPVGATRRVAPTNQTIALNPNDWQIRLPTEWEWQWAAQGGEAKLEYPWGEWDKHPRANTTEAGIQDRSTAIGMYPHGIAECGALDMSGNLREWCLNEYRKPENISVNTDAARVLRGGAFNDNQNNARCVYRNSNDPGIRLINIGFRVVCAAVPN